MKLTSLLAQYLYKNHRLDLPGIGTFLLDPSTISTVESSKQRSTLMDGISFKSNSSIKEAPDLIAYISSQTGKMKALAIADLESHIQLIQQFLNLGKPFIIEGIGTLVRKKQGIYEFSALSVPTEKLKDLNAKEPKSVTLEESASKEYESFLSAPKVPVGWKRPVIALLVIAGVGLAIWGGYTISRNAATNDNTEVSGKVPEPAQPSPDSTAITQQAIPKKDINYKYVLQISPKLTAMRRYDQLRTNLWDVQMETEDSVKFKLFLLLPSMNADTTHILDSLIALTGKKVYIEHN